MVPCFAGQQKCEFDPVRSVSDSFSDKYLVSYSTRDAGIDVYRSALGNDDYLHQRRE